MSNKGGVTYSKVYDILANLVEKGLVTIVPEKTKKYVPNSPQSILNLIESKKKKLDFMKEKFSELKSFYDTKEKNAVLMGVGRAAFFKMFDELEPSKEFFYSIKWSSDWRPDWAESVKKNIKSGIDERILARFDDETKINVKKWQKINHKIKILPNEGVVMSIDENAVLISLIKSNTTLIIRDKPFTKIMKKMFLETYKNAEEVK